MLVVKSIGAQKCIFDLWPSESVAACLKYVVSQKTVATLCWLWFVGHFEVK